MSLKEIAPINVASKETHSIPLPKTLQEATRQFMKPDSKARDILGNAFVDHFGKTRVKTILSDACL